jgi:hypothetical protein
MDTDLQQIYDAAGRITPAGVRRLVDALQWYRDGVRLAFVTVEGYRADAAKTTSLDRINGCFDLSASAVAELQWRLDLDHIDVGEVT